MDVFCFELFVNVFVMIEENKDFNKHIDLFEEKVAYGSSLFLL
jgi:hypothetical protein